MGLIGKLIFALHNDETVMRLEDGTRKVSVALLFRRAWLKT